MTQGAKQEFILTNRRFSAIVFYLPLHKFEKNKFENFSILISDALFITDLWIIPEG